MEIEVLNKVNTTAVFSPQIGERTIELIGRIAAKMDDEERDTLKRETVHILSNCTNPHLNEEQEATHLTVGYVQSGKTLSFTTLSALAADNGYRVIIYLAGTKNNLLDQTTRRLSKDLLNEGGNSRYYKLFEGPDENQIKDIRSKLRMQSKPIVLITVLKHYKHISNLSKIFSDTQIKQTLQNQAVLIIDDEADQASLNGFAYQNSKKEAANSKTKSVEADEWDKESPEYKESSTYASILALRESLPNHSYVQYTATPQGPLLINILDLLSPKTHTVLTPGKKYTGGKLFFKERPELILSIPDEEVYHSTNNDLPEMPKSLVDATMVHILSVVLNVYCWEKVNFLSMMIHADMRNSGSRKFQEWVIDLKENWSEKLELPSGDMGRSYVENQFEKVYYEEAVRLYPKADIPDFSKIKQYLPDVVNDTMISLVISANDAQRVVKWENNCSHILIGGEMLNRGYTVENLAITYMPRYSKSKSMADTIQQRCRFFGYKQVYINSCRVYLPNSSIEEYVEYVEHEEEMREWLKKYDSLRDIERQLILSEKLNPTRKNILSVDIESAKMKGWHGMNTFRLVNENKVTVESLFANNKMQLWDKQYGTDDRNHKYVQLPIADAIDFLVAYKCKNFPDTTRKAATVRYLNYLSNRENDPIKYVYVIQMAFNSPYRERTFNTKSEKVSQLFSGYDKKGLDVYPGDKAICKSDFICIQIHKIKLKTEEVTHWNGVVGYTLAIYYPEEYASRYISNI